MFRKFGAILVAVVAFVTMAASPALADEHWFGFNGNQGAACGGKSFVLNANMFREDNTFYTDQIDFGNNGNPGTWLRADNTSNVDWVKVQVRKTDTNNVDVLVNEYVRSNPDQFGDFIFDAVNEVILTPRHPYLKAIVKWNNGDSCSAKLSWKHNWEG